MADMQFDESTIERMKACTNAQEVMAILQDEGFELNDEQLEAVVGGAVVKWSLEDLLASFGDALVKLFPKDFDHKTIWANLPTQAMH
jgi:hypothetical protein